jgi:hypothetical protein
MKYGHLNINDNYQLSTASTVTDSLAAHRAVYQSRNCGALHVFAPINEARLIEFQGDYIEIV